MPFLPEREVREPGGVQSLLLAAKTLPDWRVSGLTFLLFVLPDVNPVSLQLDLDRRFQLQDILMDFKVGFLGRHGIGEGTMGDAS